MKTICGVQECGGEINFNKPVKLSVSSVGEACYDVYFPCNKCKRLHSRGGQPVVNRQGQKVFLNDEDVVRKLY